MDYLDYNKQELGSFRDMKKEVIIAILIGLTLGLVVTYGIYRAKTSFTQHTSNRIAIDSPSPLASAHSSLTLLAPDDESVQSGTDTKVTGTTDPDAVVVILWNAHQKITTADKSGNFSVQLQLDQNSNIIVVRAITENGDVAEEQRIVVVTNVSLDQTNTASGSATPASPTSTLTPTPRPNVLATPKATPKATPSL